MNIYNMSNKHGVPNQVKHGLCELCEIKKDYCKAYMVTYQLSNWIKAGVYLSEDPFLYTTVLQFCCMCGFRSLFKVFSANKVECGLVD